MGKCLNLCALVLGCGLVFGCAAQKSGEAAEQARAERFLHSYEASLNEEQELAGQKLLQHARSAIGTPYVRGGSTPGGFDCSGFVSWAFKNVGVKLPRTAREQSVVGERITNIEDMRAGDIVAFRHPRRGYHTGIYVGDGKFIHSPRKRTRVRINSLSDPYFSKTLLGARRVNIGNGENLVAQAESRLGAYAEARSSQKSGKSVAATSAKAGKSVKAQRAKSSRVTKATGKSGNTKTLTKKSGKTARSVASAQKASGGKAAVKTGAKNDKSRVSTVAQNAGSSRAARHAKPAARKSAHKTVSALHGKNGRNRS